MKLQTRSARKRREALKKLGVWIFLVIFAASVVGVAVVGVASTR